MQINTRMKAARVHGKDIPLTPTEYAILNALAASEEPVSAVHVRYRNGDLVMLNGLLLKWHVSRIRKKLGKDVIITRRDYGYLLRDRIVERIAL